MERRSWPLIAAAFSALLAIVAISGYDVAYQTRQLRESILKTQFESQLRSRVLREVRDNSAAMAIAIRDALIDPAEIQQPVRGEMEALHQSILSGLDRLQSAKEPRQSELVAQCKSLHEQYWVTARTALGWSTRERGVRSIEFLRRKLAPLRISAMQSAERIELVEAILLSEHQARVTAAFAQVESSLQTTWMVTIAIGLGITLLTVWRVRRLEFNARALQSQTASDREQLRVLSQQLVRAHEDERKALSRELHDQIGQMLTGIQMTLASIQTGRGDVQQQIEDGKLLTERTVKAIRDISMGLRPSILDDLGLAPAIEWQAREFSKRSGVTVEHKIDGRLEYMSEAEKICLYRVIQEALTNCARHANANRVRISLHVSRDLIELRVEDDGRGFDTAVIPNQGLGLIGIRERVRELGGTVSIMTQPDKGTVLKAEISRNLEVQT
jgi:signal transduction histidine kinase